MQVWADRIVEYVGKRDGQTAELAKYLDQLSRKGLDAERILGLAAARKPLPVDHPTAALAYRVKHSPPRGNAVQPDRSTRSPGRANNRVARRSGCDRVWSATVDSVGGVIDTPSPDEVCKYLHRWHEQGNENTDSALRKLFDTMPRNVDAGEVSVKVAALNGL